MRNTVSAMCYTDKITGKTFLAYISYNTLAEVQKEAKRINQEKPERLRTGEPAKCDKRIYWAQEQEEF